MKKAIKAFATVVSVAMLANVFIASACTNNDNSEPADEWAVTLQYKDENSRPRIMYVEKGKSIPTPATPVRDGYQLSKWVDKEENGSTVSFPYTPTSDVTLYAEWEAASCTITFDYNITGSTPYIMNKKYDSKITEEEVNAISLPANAGQKFRYWTARPDSKAKVDFKDYTVSDDTTFYARWIPEDTDVYNLNFYLNDETDTLVSTIEVEEGDIIAQSDAPETPKRLGYKFLGWSTDAGATSANGTVSFPYTPEGSEGNDVNLYAIWEKATYTVRYYYNYIGSPNNDLYKTETVLGGEEMVEPEEITRVQDGVTFEFDGWYTGEVNGDKVEFPAEPTSSMSLYAHWKAPLTAMKEFDNKFDAEYTPIDPTSVYPGYSNDVKGTEIIQPDNNQNSFSAPYPILPGGKETTQRGHFVYCMYQMGAQLTFNIYSSKAATGIDLYANLSLEMVSNDIVMTPEGTWGFAFIVNDQAINYGSVTVKGGTNVGSSGFMGTFSEVKIGKVDLVEGWNTIILRTNNSTSIGGVSKAWAPMIDYIRLNAGSKTELSWRPEYDNLYRAK